jgi:hypothetical protein
MSRIQSLNARLLREQALEQGLQKAKDKRLVAEWFRKGEAESAQMTALDWLQRRREACEATGVANGERVACTRSPDASRAAKQDAMNDVAGALAAVRTRAGDLCWAALDELIENPRVKFAPLRKRLKVDANRVKPIVLHALEALAAYREECIEAREKWNRRVFIP